MIERCSCGEPAEVRWIVNGPKDIRQEHKMCSNCLSTIWEQINLKYSGSFAKECSTFESINQ